MESSPNIWFFKYMDSIVKSDVIFILKPRVMNTFMCTKCIHLYTCCALCIHFMHIKVVIRLDFGFQNKKNTSDLFYGRYGGNQITIIWTLPLRTVLRKSDFARFSLDIYPLRSQLSSSPHSFLGVDRISGGGILPNIRYTVSDRFFFTRCTVCNRISTLVSGLASWPDIRPPLYPVLP